MSISVLSLYLTPDEARELRDSLNGLLARTPPSHEHINDFDSEKELTICIYDPDKLGTFDERSRRLLTENV